MRSLNKVQLAERDAHVEAMEAASDDVQEAVEAFNAAMADHMEAVSKAVTAYNEKLNAANEFIATLRENAEGYAADRSEQWHDSEAGGRYAEWIEQFAELNDIEACVPDPMEDPDELGEATEVLRDLAASPAEL